MAKPTYFEVQTLINDLIAAHKRVDDGYEYCRAVGNLSAILGCLIEGDISRTAAFESLQDTVKRVTAEVK